MLLSSAYFEQCHVQRASSEKARATKKKSALARACAGYWLPLRCCINVCCHAAAGSGLFVCTFPALSSSAQAILRGRPFSRSQAPERDDEVRWARCLLCAGGFASGKSQAWCCWQCPHGWLSALRRARLHHAWTSLDLGPELELIRFQMAQKPMHQGEVGAHALRVKSVSRGEGAVWASAGVQCA